jgi:hypothetical protein
MPSALLAAALLQVLLPVRPVLGSTPVEGVSLEARVAPLVTGLRWDDNVYRDPGPGQQADAIASAGCGAIVLSDVRSTWRAEVSGSTSADLYRTHDRLDNVLNRIRLSLESLPGPIRGSFHKRYGIRRSQEVHFDHWDDQSGLGIVWTPSHAWSAEARYENSMRRYYDGSAAVRARNRWDDTVSLDGVFHLEDRLSVQVGALMGRREYNRYAVARTGGDYHLRDEPQQDDTAGARMALRWFASSVLNEVTLQFQRTDSNNVGSSYRSRSISWAAGVTPHPRFTLQALCRLFRKEYDSDPLELPEFRLGFDEEEGEDLLSMKTVWEFSPRWDLGLTATRLRAESEVPGRFYVKKVLSSQVQRRF